MEAPAAPVVVETPPVVATPAPPAAPAATAAAPSPISPVALEAVGLQMVETDPSKHVAVTTAPAEKPVRKPRTPRAKPVVVDEPLQMVETRKD